MRIAVFSAKPYDRRFLEAANADAGHDLVFYEAGLQSSTTVLADGFPAICAFVNDVLDAEVLQSLQQQGTRLITLRSAGFNHVDIEAAEALGLTVARVPAYSPYAVAEHTVALLLALNRRLHRAYTRVRETNFSLDGLLGFDVHDKTVGIVGTGKIGTIVARILKGFGCHLLAYDLYPNDTCRDLGVEYVALDDLFARSDIITLHTPLTPDTYHLIDEAALEQMQDGVMLLNTSRGALVDTLAVIDALKAGRVGALGLDVYEEEGDLFFEDLSDHVIQDDTFARLLTFPNVLITGHQAFFTEEAMSNIAETTLGNVTAFEQDGEVLHPVTTEMIA
ncbi:MAG: 2-hydroxyacid dehydrogenase [Bacteroidetes bacterium]|jgi:D-lactate dehydrogenase|nr:2-hydroxyacid dehydrogenase [Bacteroidota bacterium]